MGTDLFGAAGGGDTARLEARFADPLTIHGVKPGEGGTVALDDYIPFAFESAAGTAGAVTFAITDGDHALCEVAVDRATGRLRGVTLVSFARRARPLPFDPAALPASDGLPVLALSPDAGGRIARPGAVELLEAPGARFVQLAPGTPTHAIRAGEALVLVAGDTLWGIGATGLSSMR